MREGICALLAGHPGLSVTGVAEPDAVDLAATHVDGVRRVLVLGDTGGASGTGGADSQEWSAAFAVIRLVDVLDPSALADMVLAAANRLPARQPDSAVVAAPPVPAGRAALTPRERAVLRAVGRGDSAAQIAGDLGISPRTVERLKQSVMAKLGAPTQARAVAVSLAEGLLQDVG